MPTKHFQKAVFQEKNMWIRIRKKKKMKKNLHMQLQGSLIKKVQSSTSPVQTCYSLRAFDTLWNEGWTVEQLKSYIKYGHKTHFDVMTF